MVRVSVGARLHFGFGNLSLSHERLYGSLGAAIAEPRVDVEADPADEVTISLSLGAPSRDPEALVDDVRTYAERACDLLDASGATVTIHESLPRHSGLGSGTALALAILTAIARAHNQAPAARERAPAMGRGGRSGIGVASFERGGFVLDAGHPTTRFTTDRPSIGSWEVPNVAARHPVPDDWRFLLVRPATGPGRSGEAEDESMRSVVERANPTPADRIAGIVVRRVLPAIAEGHTETFGQAVAEIGRLNGTWYADEQGGVYRPPVGDVVASLEGSSAVFGAGQSSWGPTVFGVTDVDQADAAAEAGEAALDAAGVDGDVRVVHGRNGGAQIEDE